MGEHQGKRIVFQGDKAEFLVESSDARAFRIHKHSHYPRGISNGVGDTANGIDQKQAAVIVPLATPVYGQTAKFSSGQITRGELFPLLRRDLRQIHLQK